ncbi:MAG: InlB B-repeat-containing protein, partial [Prevotella sp.]|nr:InlB B-repeat-containing protein [Prevotella sp.]
DANGGENTPERQTETQGEDLIITEDVPTKKGYVFIGWNTEDDGTGCYDRRNAHLQNLLEREIES